MLALGCIADDYTGASDLAGVLSNAGLRTVQTIGPSAGLNLGDFDAVVVALKSRSVAAERAIHLSVAAFQWLKERGAGHVLFKICSTFDSTDKGNIGPVIEALRAQASSGAVPVNPSFVETGRTVYQGHLFVNGALLSESPLKDHPLNPMHDANLVRVLGRQSAMPVSLLPLATVEKGASAIAEALDQATAAGSGAAIVDAVAPRHLEALGEATLGRPLSCGASGLGYGLARAIVARDGRNDGADDDVKPSAGSKAAILAGSCSAATLRQIDAASSRMPCRRLDVEQLLGGSNEVDRAISWARERLGEGPVLIASSAAPNELKQIQARHGDLEVGHTVEDALAAIAAALVEAGVRRLIVAGGETSGAVIDRLGLEAMRVGEEIAPGVPALYALGARHEGLALALKSGNFGGNDFFERALGILGRN